MATRRIKGTINNHYTQSLKVDCRNPYLTNNSSNYNSILFTKKHKNRNSLSFLEVDLQTQFNSATFDGIHMSAGLLQDSKVKSSGACTFEVYKLANDGTDVFTLITTTPGTLSNQRFIKSLTEAQLPGVELDGEFTLMIKASMIRRTSTYHKKIYVNHLGIYDSFLRLKQEVEFLDLTKLDE